MLVSSTTESRSLSPAEHRISFTVSNQAHKQMFLPVPTSTNNKMYGAVKS